MSELEGFWIRNYKSMRQVGIGTCFPQFVFVDDETRFFPYQLGRTTLFAGASGTGKSTILDAFAFVSDCYLYGLDYACIKRGGYDAIHAQGAKGAISFGFQLREPGETQAATYAVSIGCTGNKIPFIESELLAYRQGKESVPVFFLQNGQKSIRYLAPDERIGTEELTRIEFTDLKHLGLAALEDHPRFPILRSVRRLFEHWVLSDFTPDPARGLDHSLPRRQESTRGMSLSGLVRFMMQHYGDAFPPLLQQVAAMLPRVVAIDIDRTESGRPALSFYLAGKENPIPITLLSGAMIRLFTFGLLLEEPDPAPLIALEEPENGLDRFYCWKLAEEIRKFDAAPEGKAGSRLLLTTHHPGFADVLHPTQVWVLEKDREGFTVVERAADSVLLEPFLEDQKEPSSRWFSDHFEQKV